MPGLAMEKKATKPELDAVRKTIEDDETFRVRIPCCARAPIALSSLTGCLFQEDLAEIFSEGDYTKLAMEHVVQQKEGVYRNLRLLMYNDDYIIAAYDAVYNSLSLEARDKMAANGLSAVESSFYSTSN